MMIEQELSALERISTRLQSTSNETLPHILSSLLPKIIPLSNQSSLRAKVVEIITEALRRAKISGCKLNLEVFTSLIQSNQLPFACNIGFAFLDAIADANNIENINEHTVEPFLDALESFPLFSYQSNVTLYYCLIYIDCISTAISNIHHQGRKLILVNRFGEYLLDFMILQYGSVGSNSVGGVQPGLSERRMNRFAIKNKRFESLGLKALKLNCLESLVCDCFAKSYFSVIIPLIGMADADREVSSKSIQIINRLKELPQQNSADRIDGDLSNTLSTAFGLSLTLELDSFVVERSDRIPMRHEVILNVLDYLDKNISRYKGIHHGVVLAITDNIMLPANLDPLLSSWISFICSCLTTFPTLGGNFEFLSFLVNCVETIVQDFTMTSLTKTMSLDASNTAIKLRYNVFNLLHTIITLNPKLASGKYTLLDTLLQIAERDDLSSSTALFAIIDVFKDIIDMTSYANGPTSIKIRLEKLKISEKASCRLLYLQWTQKVYGWNEDALIGMILMSEDKVEMVSNHAKRMFGELRHSTLNNPPNAPITIKAVAGALARWEFMGNLTNLCVGSGVQLCISLMCSCINLMDVDREKVQNDLSYYPIFEVHRSVDQLYYYCTSDDQMVSILTKILCILSTVDIITLSNDNIYYFMDENWADIDGLRISAEGEEMLIAGHQEFSFLVDCVSVVWFLFRAIQSKELLFPFEDALFKLSQRKEKVIRCMAVKCISVLAIANNRTKVEEGNHITHRLFGVIESSNSPFISIAVCSSILVLSVLSCMEIEHINHGLLSSRLYENFLKAVNTPRSRTNSEESILFEISFSDLIESIGIVLLYRHQNSSEMVKVFSTGLMDAFSDLDQLFKLNSTLICVVIHAIGRASWHSKSFSDDMVLRLCTNQWLARSNRVVALCIGTVCGRLKLRHEGCEGLIEFYFQSLKNLDRLIESSDSPLKASYISLSLASLYELRSACTVVPLKMFENGLYIGLQYLRESNAYIQDMSSLHLSVLYDLSKKVRTDPLHDFVEGLKKFPSLSDFIANEIAATVSKKKRPLQPSGYDSSGRGQSVQTDNEIHQIPQIDITLPTGGERDEVLEAAAAIAAAQLNTTMEGIYRRDAHGDDGSIHDGYGAYAKVCSIARKSGDSAVLMQAMQLVRCDVSFGLGDSTLSYLKFRHPKVIVVSSRIPALVPMLYIAKFDPVVSVRNVMKEVWAHVVGNHESVLISKCARDIIAHACANILNPHWRERESACLALESLLHLQSWDDLKDLMSDLLTKGLKIMDDLRESTRKEAILLMKTILQIILRAVNPVESNEDVCKAGLELTLPILLEKGLVSASVEARGFSLGTLIKVIETSKKMLLPWIAQLVDVFIESISALEPQMLNYIQFHTATIRVDNEEWEKARVDLAKSSPMHEALRNCLALVPLEMLPTISNIAYFHLQSGVGLATRVAAADAISFLVERFPSGMGTYGSKALKAICSILLEHPHLENTLKKAMLNTLGMLSKVVHETILADECGELLKKYFSLLHDRTSDHELAISICIQHIIQRAGERITEDQTWTKILTASFVGSFDDDKSAAQSWTLTFSTALDSSGIGTRSAAVRKCLPTLGVVLPRMLLHRSWDKRKQSSRILREIIPLVKNLDIAETFGLLFGALFLSIPGAMWIGQDQVLQSLGEVLPRLTENFVDVENVEANIIFDIKLLIDGDTTMLTFPLDAVLLSNPSHDMELIRHWQSTFEKYLFTIDYDRIPSSFPQWKLHSFPLFQLLLRELRRGDTDYKVHTANAIARLPWKRMASIDNELILKTCPLILEVVDVFSEEVVEKDVSTNDVTSKPQAGKSRIDNQHKNDASFLFGNRYGTLPATSIVRHVANEKSAVKVVTPITGLNTRDAVEEKILSSNAASNSAENASSVVQYKAHEIKKKIAIPAVRMYLLECLSDIVSVESSNETALHGMQYTFDYFISLIERSFRGEVWSIKRAMLQFVVSIASNKITEMDVGAIIRIVVQGTEDSKFTKVRVTALESIEILLKGRYATLIRERFIDSIMSVVRSASRDSQPSILETVSRIQNLLFSFNQIKI